MSGYTAIKLTKIFREQDFLLFFWLGVPARAEIESVDQARYYLEIGKQPISMSKEEKIKLIQLLEYQGVFLLRGAVDFLAKSLGISKYTVYNYLKEIRSEPQIL